MTEPVDLDEDNARLFGHVALPVPCRELADERAEERPVITGREHGRQERVPDRKEHRADDRIDRPVEHHPPRARHEPEREGLHEDRRDRRDGDRDLRDVGDEHGTQERAALVAKALRFDCGTALLSSASSDKAYPRHHTDKSQNDHRHLPGDCSGDRDKEAGDRDGVQVRLHQNLKWKVIPASNSSWPL